VKETVERQDSTSESHANS